MRNLKDEKGAITIIVLVTMLFLLAFFMSAYIVVSNRAQNQKKMSDELQKLYNQSPNLDELYNSYFENDLIPIYTVDELLKIGSGEVLEINNKYYIMNSDETYVLMSNLTFDVDDYLSGNDWIPINSNESFTGYFEGNGHTITVTNSEDDVIIYSPLNNYKEVQE